MKFEEKFIDASKLDVFEVENTCMTKDIRGSFCHVCGDYTRWFDVKFEKYICQNQCVKKAWEEVDLLKTDAAEINSVSELGNAINCVDASKDIIMVVRDQLEYTKQAIESIQEHTSNYKLWIWDNDSGPETKRYLDELLRKYNNACQEGDIDWSVEVWNSDSNKGFNEPNNKIAEVTRGDYIIPVNSDVKVFKHWDTAMIAHLQKNNDTKQVGYVGGLLSDYGHGVESALGSEVDYIPGWCFCISRETYEEFGLFNKQLRFAYFEDSDLSLRIKEKGHKIYALYSSLVVHFQNKTISAVRKEGDIDVNATFEYNQNYFVRRWKDYLEKERILLSRVIN